MNNARYLRELDFARVDFYERTGLYKKIRQKGGAVVQGACTIRYRRFVRPFSVFKITSKVNENVGQISHFLHCQGLTETIFKITQVIYRSLMSHHTNSALLHIETVTIETKKVNPLTSSTNLLSSEPKCAAICLRLCSTASFIHFSFVRKENEALILYTRVTPSGFAILYYTFDVQLFLQPQRVDPREPGRDTFFHTQGVISLR